MSLLTISELISKCSQHSITVLAFYIPKQLHLHDLIVVRNNKFVSKYSNLTIEQMRLEYPTITIVTFDEAELLINDAALLPVSEIDSERYHDMLEVLPPLNWTGGEEADSFKIIEMYCGSVTSIFASIIIDNHIDSDDHYSTRARRYFTLRDNVNLAHSEIIKRCYEYMSIADNASIDVPK